MREGQDSDSTQVLGECGSLSSQPLGDGVRAFQSQLAIDTQPNRRAVGSGETLPQQMRWRTAKDKQHEPLILTHTHIAHVSTCAHIHVNTQTHRGQRDGSAVKDTIVLPMDRDLIPK